MGRGQRARRCASDAAADRHGDLGCGQSHLGESPEQRLAVGTTALNAAYRLDGEPASADVRASQAEASQPQGNSGTLSGSVDLDTGTVRGEISGRLRHLRALYDDGTARNEAWTVATPPTLRFSYENTDCIRFLLTPEAAMAVTADRVALRACRRHGRFRTPLRPAAGKRARHGVLSVLVPRQPSCERHRHGETQRPRSTRTRPGLHLRLTWSG